MSNSSFTLDQASNRNAISDGRVLLNTALLKQLRLESGFSQAKLAEVARDKRQPLSIASIKRAELGDPVIYRTALQLASLFNVNVNDLIIQPSTARRSDFELISRPHELQMIGRESELHQVQFALKHTLQTRQSRLVYLRGVAGIGKTCLFEQIRLMTREIGYRTACCAVSSPLLSDSKNMLAVLTQALLSSGDEDSPEALTERVARLDLESSLRCQILGFMGLPLSEEEQQLQASMTHTVRQEKQRKAVVQAIDALAKDSQLALMIEDLHWADEVSIPMLSLIIYETRCLPLIWVITSRYEQDPLDTRIRPYLADYPVNIIELAPLPAHEAQRLALQVLPDNPGRRQACIDQAQGNPLFLTQLLLSKDDMGLPQSLMELIRLKLTALNDIDREAIQIAATIQGEFSLTMLQTLMRMPQYSAATRSQQIPGSWVGMTKISLPHYSAANLGQHNLVRHCANNHLMFVHDLIMRGIEAQIPDELRRDYHARIARYYAAQDARLHAIHLTKANDPGAPQALLIAVKDCCASYHFTEALELLRLYEQIDFATLDSYQNHLLHGRVLAAMGNNQAACEHQEKALEQSSELEQALTVVVELARTLNVLDKLALEEALLAKYISQAKAANCQGPLGQLLYLQGTLYFPKGDYKRSRELHLEARQVAQSTKDVRTEALALSGLGDSYYAQGWMIKATDIFRICLTLCEAHGLADVEASNRFMLATTRLYLNETPQALQDALASAQLGGSVGNLRAEIVSRLTAGWLYSSQGAVAEALEQYECALQIAHNISANRFVPFLLEGVAKCHHIAGRTAQAIETIRKAWTLVEEQNLHRFIGPWVLGTRSIVERDESLRSQAIDLGLKLIQNGSVAHNHYRFYVSAGEAAVQSRNAARASHMADLLEQFTADQPCPWADHHIQLIRQHVRLLLQPFKKDDEQLQILIADGKKLGLSFVAPQLHQQLN